MQILMSRIHIVGVAYEGGGTLLMRIATYGDNHMLNTWISHIALTEAETEDEGWLIKGRKRADRN